MLNQRTKVDEHAHTYQKEGYEQGIAHKLDVAHQGRRGRNEPVEHKAHQEGTQYALHAHKLHQART